MQFLSVISLLIVVVLVVFVAYLLGGVLQVLVIDKKRYARYWQKRAARPVPEGAIRLVALGDSTFQAIGATRPQLGTVGRVASHLRQTTGRPVHVTNLSVSGAKAVDVANRQLSKADFKSADIVIVAVGANDGLKQSDDTLFKQSIDKIVAAVPPEKTIMADVALVKNREHYQELLANARTKRKLIAANLSLAFSYVDHRRSLSARDFFHPSDYGYQIWFEAFRPGVDYLIEKHKLAK